MSDSQSKAARLRTLTAQPPIVEKWTRNQNVCTLPFALRWSSLGLEHLKKRKEMGSNQFVDDSKRKERKLEIVSIRRFMFLVAVNIGSDSARNRWNAFLSSRFNSVSPLPCVIFEYPSVVRMFQNSQSNSVQPIQTDSFMIFMAILLFPLWL